ncbi:hypothetical protein [Victivallis vadensis]|uniref:Uncharacterized protein n=1 Tax=Victivallis vadensis TaxID=172901 RepID=A0A2U1AFP9_9BACT|nr:hypothetical protein [Victivallis vadensis]PVY35177.1 hypothetical protein C8D82_1424 [Victivallis vadensis]
MFLGSSCCNIAENSTFARPLDFACRLNPSFHAFAEACATETLGAYFATTESGFDLIEVDTATETDPGVRLSATLRVDLSGTRIEFYEFAIF